VLDKIEAGERPTIFGDGSQAYDFVHVGDVARANILAMKSEATDVNLNVGTGIKTTIKELVDTLLEETESDIEPEYIADAQMFVTHRVGSTELAEELTGFKAELPYREGLRSVIEWRRSDQARALA
jgi:UDP-glucose 4-epimerase